MHPDPFLRSMAFWILKDPSASLNTLLQTNVGSNHPQYHDDDRAEGSTGSAFNILIFQYCYIVVVIINIFFQQIQMFSTFMSICEHILCL
jgi:hypothetical protein